MKVVIIGADKGAKPLGLMVEHVYELVADELLHLTDGQLRARVPLEDPNGGESPVIAFLADHPEAAPALGDVLEDLESRVSEYKRQRAKHLAEASRSVSPVDHGAIERAVNQAVTRALVEAAANQRRA